MIQEKSVEKLEKSAVRLTVTVGSADTKVAYDKLLAEYGRKAHIKGFRPGKVPVSVLEAKFGESLRAEAAQNTVEAALHEAFDQIDEKPLPYAQPRMDEAPAFVPGEAFTFQVVYDVYPTVSLGAYQGLKLEEPQVSIGKEDLERELAQIQDQNAIVTEVKEGKTKDGDMVTVTFSEVGDDGEEVAGSARQDYTLTLGKGEAYYGFDAELTGKEKDKELSFTKKYAADYPQEELAGRSIKFKATITRIRRKDLPTLDDELAQDVDSRFKTLDDLKKDIQDRLEKQAKERVRQKLVDSLMEQVVAASTLDLPDSMVNSQLYNQYERFVRQLGGNENTLVQLLAAQGKTVDNLLEDWRPSAEKSLRTQVVIEELLKKETVEVSEEEITAEFNRIGEESRMDGEQARAYYKENRMEDLVVHELKERKLFDKLIAASTVKKGAKVKYLDLLGQKP